MNFKTQILTGDIDANGVLIVHENDQKDDFLQKHKYQKVIITYEIVDNTVSHGLRKYFFAKVVPDCTKAMYELGEVKKLNEVYDMLKKSCPLMWHEEYNIDSCEYIEELRSLSDLTSKEWKEFISFIRMWAAEQLHVYIEDPYNSDYLIKFNWIE